LDLGTYLPPSAPSSLGYKRRGKRILIKIKEKK